jgi:hypothetical protein
LTTVCNLLIHLRFLINRINNSKQSISSCCSYWDHSQSFSVIYAIYPTCLIRNCHDSENLIFAGNYLIQSIDCTSQHSIQRRRRSKKSQRYQIFWKFMRNSKLGTDCKTNYATYHRDVRTFNMTHLFSNHPPITQSQ